MNVGIHSSEDDSLFMAPNFKLKSQSNWTEISFFLFYLHDHQQQERSTTSRHISVTLTDKTLGLVPNRCPSLHCILLLRVSFIPDLPYCPSSQLASAIFSGWGSSNAQQLSDVTFHTPDSCTTITLTLMHWQFSQQAFCFSEERYEPLHHSAW